MQTLIQKHLAGVRIARGPEYQLRGLGYHYPVASGWGAGIISGNATEIPANEFC